MVVRLIKHSIIEVPEYSFVQKKKLKLPDNSYSASLNNKFSLTDVKWDYFNIKDLFNVSASKDKVLLDHSSGKTLMLVQQNLIMVSRIMLILDQQIKVEPLQ